MAEIFAGAGLHADFAFRCIGTASDAEIPHLLMVKAEAAAIANTLKCAHAAHFHGPSGQFGSQRLCLAGTVGEQLFIAGMETVKRTAAGDPPARLAVFPKERQRLLLVQGKYPP
ncbi:hypothetical protein [Paracoccus pantotrophus]|uniref:hypothetical protein n=1 Tax=Paracoccus pantotrophus TaxID=82367 RepID=UPI001160CE85|nr:hypothetical protein [Paracoccus pantotrophus]MDF3855123.1 hypothetical protein [Paracoccus pantotrophus]